MKSRKVETITSNDEWVRLEIFEGRIPMEKAAEELLSMERKQHAATHQTLLDERRAAASDMETLARRGLMARVAAWWRGDP